MLAGNNLSPAAIQEAVDRAGRLLAAAYQNVLADTLTSAVGHDGSALTEVEKTADSRSEFRRKVPELFLEAPRSPVGAQRNPSNEEMTTFALTSVRAVRPRIHETQELVELVRNSVRSGREAVKSRTGVGQQSEAPIQACLTLVEHLYASLFPQGIRASAAVDDGSINLGKTEDLFGGGADWHSLSSWDEVSRALQRNGQGSAAFILARRPHGQGHAFAAYHSGEVTWIELLAPDGEWLSSRAPGISSLDARALVVTPDGRADSDWATSAVPEARLAQALADLPTSREFQGGAIEAEWTFLADIGDDGNRHHAELLAAWKDGGASLIVEEKEVYRVDDHGGGFYRRERDAQTNGSGHRAVEMTIIEGLFGPANTAAEKSSMYRLYADVENRLERINAYPGSYPNIPLENIFTERDGWRFTSLGRSTLIGPRPIGDWPGAHVHHNIDVPADALFDFLEHVHKNTWRDQSRGYPTKDHLGDGLAVGRIVAARFVLWQQYQSGELPLYGGPTSHLAAVPLRAVKEIAGHVAVLYQVTAAMLHSIVHDGLSKEKAAVLPRHDPQRMLENLQPGVIAYLASDREYILREMEERFRKRVPDYLQHYARRRPADVSANLSLLGTLMEVSGRSHRDFLLSGLVHNFPEPVGMGDVMQMNILQDFNRTAYEVPSLVVEVRSYGARHVSAEQGKRHNADLIRVADESVAKARSLRSPSRDRLRDIQAKLNSAASDDAFHGRPIARELVRFVRMLWAYPPSRPSFSDVWNVQRSLGYLDVLGHVDTKKAMEGWVSSITRGPAQNIEEIYGAVATGILVAAELRTAIARSSESASSSLAGALGTGQRGWSEPATLQTLPLPAAYGRALGASVTFSALDSTARRVARELIDVPAEVEQPVAARTEAARLIALLLHDETVANRVAESGVRVVVIPRTQALADLPHFADAVAGTVSEVPYVPFGTRGWTDVERKLVAIGEENLLGRHPHVSASQGVASPHRGEVNAAHPEGYSSALHEAAHLVYGFGLDAAQRAAVESIYQVRTGRGEDVEWVDGPGAGNYSASNAAEYFAQSTVAYFGANYGRDAVTNQQRNNGAEWIRVHDPELHTVLYGLYGSPPEKDLGANSLSVTQVDDQLWAALRDHTSLTEGDAMPASAAGDQETSPESVDELTRGEQDRTTPERTSLRRTQAGVFLDAPRLSGADARHTATRSGDETASAQGASRRPAPLATEYEPGQTRGAGPETTELGGGERDEVLPAPVRESVPGPLRRDAGVHRYILDAAALPTATSDAVQQALGLITEDLSGRGKDAVPEPRVTLAEGQAGTGMNLLHTTSFLQEVVNRTGVSIVLDLGLGVGSPINICPPSR